MKIEILVKGKKATKPIFGCLGCECVFTANADEFYYDSNDETNYCCCPECGTKCTGTEINCYWRKGINYVPFCAISFLPCIKVIEDGKCQTLNELDKKEGENNADI